MGTKLHGPLSAQNLDSAGEVVDLAGLDTSALKVSNYEHSSDLPGQNVGRVIYSKKIFGPQDCENEVQLKFLNRLKGCPYLYGIIELFDDVGHDGARDVAAMAKYDAKNTHLYDYTNTFPLVGGSIEGSKISKEGHVVNKSLARKLSITVSPCNRVCYLELMPEENQQVEKQAVQKGEKTRQKGILEKMLKFEGIAPEMESLVKSELEDMKKSEGGGASTKSGKIIPTDWDPGHYAKNKFSSQDHKDAMNVHYEAAMNTTNPTQKQHHMKMVGRHQSAAERSPWSSKNPSAIAPKSPAQSGIHTVPSPASKSVPHVNPSTNVGYVNVPGKGRGMGKMEKAITATNSPLNPETWAKTGDIAKANDPLKSRMTSGKGISDQGIEARRGDIRTGGISHGVGKVSMSAAPKHMANAKKIAQHTLGQLQNQPKPNLPKSEDMEKGMKGDWKKEGYSISHRESPEHYVVEAKDKQGNVVGKASFKANSKGTKLIPHHAAVKPEHQRKGIATGMYSHAEKTWKTPIANKASHQTDAAANLWAQKNRPFGKSEDMRKAEPKQAADLSIPTWNKVEMFRSWLSQKMPDLSKNELNAFTRAFKLFKIKQAEKKLEDMK